MVADIVLLHPRSSVCYDGFDFSDSACESYVAAPGVSEFERWTGVESICIAAEGLAS